MESLFQESFNFKEHRIYGKIKNTDLLKSVIEIPNEQRLKDNLKINEIVEYQENHLKKYGCYNFLGVINIHFNKDDSKYYIVDGQHRYFAIRKLTNRGHSSIMIMIELVFVDNRDELKSNYELINKNTELPEFPDTIDKNIPETVANNFFEKYENIWSSTRRVRRPHINKNYFQESLGILTDKLDIKNPQRLMDILEKYNDKLKHWPFCNFPGYKTFKDKSKIEEKCRGVGLYLGLFPYKNDDYCFGWVKNIIEEYTGKAIKNSSRIKTNKLPKKVRIDSWNRYIGESVGSVYCICCVTTKITQGNFQAGHIIPKSKGGENVVDNILPICGQCNGSMMTKEMGGYISEYYPHNLEAFKKREYRHVLGSEVSLKHNMVLENEKDITEPHSGFLQSLFSI